MQTCKHIIEKGCDLGNDPELVTTMKTSAAESKEVTEVVMRVLARGLAAEGIVRELVRKVKPRKLEWLISLE